MLKMFHVGAAAPSGDTPDFWDNVWEQNELRSVLLDRSVCENDPLFPLFQQTLRRDRLFLEGGCGQAQWVKYFSDRGYECLGIDFAPRVIDGIKRAAPELDVRVGDVMRLPLADGAVHTYYSGGVVEHFEDGPERALAEARRVIADDGWFLCSVPDLSPLRRILFRGEGRAPFATTGVWVRNVRTTQPEEQRPDVSFFQYAFSEDEFTSLLEAAGFSVERTFGYAVVWGLTELPGLASLIQHATAAARLLKRSRTGSGATVAATDEHGEAGNDDGKGPLGDGATSAPASGRARLVETLKRAFVREDATTPVLGPVVAALRERCANMRMYVARPAKPRRIG